MKLHSKLLERVALNADLPSERLPGLPLVELAGDKRVLIENHRGVIVYGCNEIHIRVCFGCICIYGNCLELKHMSKQQLIITGRIDCITLRRGNH